MRLFLLLSAAVILAGCEGHFAGDLPYNIQILNAPLQMKIVSVGGVTYLGVLNQNITPKALTGSLHFYDLTTPRAPIRNADLSLEAPSNAADFEIDGTTLYIADRNLKRVLIYDYSGGKFQQRLDAQSQPVVILVTDQPQGLLVFSRASDSVKILAVVCQASGLIHFVRTDTLEMVSRGDSTTVTPDTYTLNNHVGTAFYLTPRRILKTTEDDPINIPQSPPSVGINQILNLGGTDQIFVTASSFSMAMFSFRLDTFQNASNLVWNLEDARDGKTVDNQEYPGSHENGFRAIAQDGNGNVYAVGRADSGFYKIPRSDFERSKDLVGGDAEAKRNTQGFDKNIPGHEVVVLDTVLTDKIFPRLTGLAVNYCPPGTTLGPHCTENGAEATTAWALGLGQKDGTTVQLYPKVYRINMSDGSFTTSADGALGEKPQKILWYAAESLLYVANLLSDKITILNDDANPSVVGTIQN